MMPSLRRSSRQVRSASLSGTLYAFFTRERSHTGGTKSSPMPSTTQLPTEPGILPVWMSGARIEPSGSASTISVAGETCSKKTREPGDGAASADAADHRVDLLCHLHPDLGSGGFLVGVRIRLIAELVRVEGARGFARDARGHVLVVLGMALGDVRAGEPHFGAERLQVKDFFLAHLVRHDDEQAIALLRGDERQPKAGVAGGGLDDQRARLDFLLAFGGFDHRECNAVLDGTARVLLLQLQEEAAAAGVEARDLHERSVADEIDDVHKHASGGTNVPD